MEAMLTTFGEAVAVRLQVPHHTLEMPGCPLGATWRSPWLDGRQEQLELREIRSSRREGVSPLQCWESRKARVRRTELTTVCYSQGRQMGIGDEIPGCLPLDKHLP
jgi:hypothetical protein